LKHKIRQILSLSDEFKEQIDKSTSTINDYCGDLKSKINFHVEKKKKELDLMREELLGKVNSYQTECVSNWQKLDNTLFAQGLEQAQIFAQKWKNYLKNIKIDENVLLEQSQAADTCLSNLETLLGQLKGAQFSGQQMKFKANESTTEPIGVFEFEKLETPPPPQLMTSRASQGIFKRNMLQ
jgi:hypothetical protein